jgi:hypothetical protein
MSKPKDSSLTSRYTTKVDKDTMLPKDSPKAQNKERKHISLQFCAFLYLHGLHEMMVLLHFDFIRGHERRLKTKRKRKRTNPNPRDMKIKKDEVSRSHLRSQIQNGQCGHTKGHAFL